MMTSFFSIDNIAITMLDYSMSWVELLATIFTLACVWLAMKKHILNWPVAIIAITLSFLVFFQSALYADSILQIYFFITSIYGWWYWSRTYGVESDVPVTRLTRVERIYWVIGVFISTLMVSYIMIHLNSWLPKLFPAKTAFPISDSLVMVTSIAGQWLLAEKKLENWFCWIVVNSTAIVIYFQKELKLFSLLYVVLLVIAIMGVIAWSKNDQELRS